MTRAWEESAAGATLRETLYSYDANGATTQFTRTGGESRQYRYDAAQRLVQVQDSSGLTIHYGYDSDGNRVSKSVVSPVQPDQNGNWRYLLDPVAPFTQVLTTLTNPSGVPGAYTAETDYRFGAGRIGQLKAGQLRY